MRSGLKNGSETNNGKGGSFCCVWSWESNRKRRHRPHATLTPRAAWLSRALASGAGKNPDGTAPAAGTPYSLWIPAWGGVALPSMLWLVYFRRPSPRDWTLPVSVTKRHWSLRLLLEGDGVDVWLDSRRLTSTRALFLRRSEPILSFSAVGPGGRRIEAARELSGAPKRSVRYPLCAMSWMFKRWRGRRGWGAGGNGLLASPNEPDLPCVPFEFSSRSRCSLYSSCWWLISPPEK